MVKQLFSTFTLKIISLAFCVGVIGTLSQNVGIVLFTGFILLYLSSGQSKQNLIAFGGFFCALIFADNNDGLQFTDPIRPIILVLLLLFFASKDLMDSYVKPLKYFGPFLVVGLLCVQYSPVPLISLSKLFSYALLIYTIPKVYFYISEILESKMVLAKTLLEVAVSVLVISLILKLTIPSWVTFVGRYSGLFRNPNGIGVFSILVYFFLFTLRPYLSSKKFWFFLGVIVISVVLSASRGAMFALILFHIFNYIKSKAGSFVLVPVFVVFTVFSFEILAILPELIEEYGYQDFFRVETLEDLSGRGVAWDFAWKNIQENFWLGRGFGFTEKLFVDNWIELSFLGHQGNAHNSYLTFWLDNGLLGVLAFFGGLLVWFKRYFHTIKIALPILLSLLVMVNFESWLTASLNPFTIIVVFILCTMEIIHQSKLKGLHCA